MLHQKGAIHLSSKNSFSQAYRRIGFKWLRGKFKVKNVMPLSAKWLRKLFRSISKLEMEDFKERLELLRDRLSDKIGPKINS